MADRTVLDWIFRLLIFCAALALAGSLVGCGSDDKRTKIMVTCTRADGVLAYKGEAYRLMLRSFLRDGSEAWEILRDRDAWFDSRITYVSAEHTCIAEEIK